MTKAKLLIATVFSIALLNSVDFSFVGQGQMASINLESEAQARSSGGRSGGGSFSRGSSGSRSSGSRSSGSSSSSRSSGSSYRSPSSSSFGSSGSRSSGSSYPSRSRTTTSPIYPVSPSYNDNYGSRSYSRSSNVNPHIGSFLLLLFVGLSGLVIFLVIFSLLRTMLVRDRSGSVAPAANELDNDIVTISKLQVALSAQATGVQKELSQLSLRVNTDTPEGLLELLQESALILLRHSEYWSHVLSSSQSISIDKAQQAFNQLSLAERSKFNAETLSNMHGNLTQKTVVSPDDETAAYIVVTLLAGTAHDRRLFQDIRSAEDLKTALEKLAATPSDYLMTFELLWSPQDESDSLTYDELLTEYTEMLQLV